MWCVYIVFFWFCMFDIIYILSYLSMYIFEIYLRSRWPNRITNFPVGQASPSSLLRTAYGGGRAVLLGAVLFRSLPFVVYSGRRVRRWLKNGAGFLASRFYWCYLVYDSINIFHYIYMWYFKMIQNISYLNIDIQKIVASKITYFFPDLKLRTNSSRNFDIAAVASHGTARGRGLARVGQWHGCRRGSRPGGAWDGIAGGWVEKKRWKMRRQTDIMWVKQWRTIPWITINS